MKKIIGSLLVALLSLAGAVSAEAQTNIQAHANVGRYLYPQSERPAVAPGYLTIEHFSMDPWGDNFFFVDLSMRRANMAEAYFEISRNLRFWRFPISLHLEYNGGVNEGFTMPHTFLTGLHWGYANVEQQWNVGLAMSYRHDYRTERPHNMQLTTTWNWLSWSRIFTLSGFADLWTTRQPDARAGVIFLAEPQLWINLNQFVGVPDDFNLSLGTEVKMSYNFLKRDAFYAMPTLAMKWTL